VSHPELGIGGAGAAVMNAIHNATGARIRDFPATPDKLLVTLDALDATRGEAHAGPQGAVSGSRRAPERP
jgi:hypothetical protein